jgi:eukaryotic-like serine/threonine-protein kinase
MSPTITTPAMTQAGMILGTAAYMSPEQAKGRPADRRSDIWALGCVLYEMLTGVRPFVGEDVADTLAHILTKEPDWSALPVQTPATIRRLLRKCVERDRTRRLDSALAVRLEIDSVGSDDAVASAAAVRVPPGRLARVPWAVAALGVLAATAAIGGWTPWRATPQPARLAFEVPVASGGGASPMMFAVSPDGMHIVARVQEAGTPRLWVRPMAETDGTVLPRTDGAAYPFWSPDGRTIGFFADGCRRRRCASETAPPARRPRATGPPP